MFDNTDDRPGSDYLRGLVIGALSAKCSQGSSSDGSFSGLRGRVAAVGAACFVVFILFLGFGLAWADGFKRDGFWFFGALADGMSFVDVEGGGAIFFDVVAGVFTVTMTLIFVMTGAVLWGYLLTYAGFGIFLAASLHYFDFGGPFLRIAVPWMVAGAQAIYFGTNRQMAGAVVRAVILIATVGLALITLYASFYAMAGCVTRLIVWLCE